MILPAYRAVVAAAVCLLLCSPAPVPAKGWGGDVEKVLSSMTVEQKAGQLFFVSLRESTPMLGATDASNQNGAHYTLTEDDKLLLADVSPGGVVLFGENVSSDGQVRRLIDDIKLQSSSRVAIAADEDMAGASSRSVDILTFISVDQEGGRVQRIRHTPSLSASTLPPMLEVGASGKTREARRAGRTIGSDLSALGFNMDFAPVCDVFSNPQNTVIGDRAFSREPRAASSMAAAFSVGLKSQRIIPCPKHFPGHGDTQSDSHYGKVILDKSLAQLNKMELIPFRRQIQDHAEAIMAAHITLPQFDDKPATLSRAIITDLLRGRLGFKGVVITDAMGMKAITLQYTNEEAAIMAIDAGCDMLLMCEDSRAAYHAVVSAVKDGTISCGRLDESVRRILLLKARYGLAVHGR